MVLTLSLLLPSLALPENEYASGGLSGTVLTPEPTPDNELLNSRYSMYSRYMASNNVEIASSTCSDEQTRELYYVYADQLAALSGSSPLGTELEMFGFDYWVLADATTFSAEQWTMIGDRASLDCYYLSAYTEMDDYSMYSALLLDGERFTPLQVNLSLNFYYGDMTSLTAEDGLLAFAYAWGEMLGGVEPESILEGNSMLYACYPSVSDTVVYAFSYNQYDTGFYISIYPT